MALDYDVESYYQLNRFIDLYKASYKVTSFKSPIDSEEYKAFVKHDGLPVGLVYPNKHEHLYPLSLGYYDFYAKSPHFWIIPCEIPGKKIIGFILRSYYDIPSEKGKPKKRYMFVRIKNTFPILFGWHRFSDFKCGDPILLTEGIKDAIFLGKYYKYTLSSLTNNVSDPCMNLLSKMTDKIVLAYDMDSDGTKGSNKVSKRFSAKGFSVANMRTTYSVKDWGNFFSLDIPEERMDTHVKALLHGAFKTIGYFS